MPKKKTKTKAGKKTIQKQKQTVIVNVTKGGGGKARASRPSQPRQQQVPQVIFQQPTQQIPQQFPQQERPHDTTIEREDRNKKHIDDILNVVQQANAIYRQQPPAQAVTTTNVDVAQILTGGASVLKTGLDIYRNYSRGQREQKEEQQREERRVDVPASNIPARPSAGHPPPPPALPPRPARPAPAQPQTPTPRQRPPVPLFPVTPAPAPAEQILKPAQTPKLPRRQPVRSLRPEMPPRSSSTGGIRKSDISDREIEKRLAILNPNLVRPPAPAPSLPTPSLPAPSPARPSFHIKNILGQIEFKGAMSSARQELKRSEEIRRKPEESKVSLGQMGARSILGGEQKDNFDFQKRASQLRREGITMRQEGLKTIRQNAKSAPSAREIPGGPPIAGKRKGY